MGALRVLIYGIIFGVYAGSLVYDVRFVRFGDEPWHYRLVMLTYINFVLQTVYSGVCLVSALFDWKEEIAHGDKHGKHGKHVHLPSYWRQTKMHRICDFMYATSAFPIGMATSLLFWMLYLINPNLVMADYVARIVPGFINHVTHTAPIGFLLVDTLLTCHHSPTRKRGSFTVLGLYGIYLGILIVTRFLYGYWLYPILGYLNNVQLSMFLVLAGVAFWFLYLVGDGLNTALWGKAPHATESDTKSK